MPPKNTLNLEAPGDKLVQAVLFGSRKWNNLRCISFMHLKMILKTPFIKFLFILINAVQVIHMFSSTNINLWLNLHPWRFSLSFNLILEKH